MGFSVLAFFLLRVFETKNFSFCFLVSIPVCYFSDLVSDAVFVFSCLVYVRSSALMCVNRVHILPRYSHFSSWPHKVDLSSHPPGTTNELQF